MSSKENNNQQRYLVETRILDFSNPLIQALIKERDWAQLKPEDQLKLIYNFVRDEIKFGYNKHDALPASEVLAEGYGQCNTKSNLFMALLRAVGIPNRIHGFTIHKELQKGAISGIWYLLSPREILHSWVEVYLAGRWFKLEGLILDKAYLQALQAKFPNCKNTFCGYGAFTDSFQNPPIDWDWNDTFIQANGIHQDFGLFNSPDDFYAIHQQDLPLLKKWVYEHYVRYRMTRNVAEIRG